MIKSVAYVLLSLVIAKNVAGRNSHSRREFKPRTFPYIAKSFDDAGVEAAAVVDEPGGDSEGLEGSQPARPFRRRRVRNTRRGNLGKNY